MSLHDNQTHGHANIACVIVAPRQSSSRRDRRNGHPDCRCVPIQIVALHAFEQPGVIAVGPGVPAQQPVRAKDPEIALSRNRRCNHGRKKVFRTRFDRLFLGRFVQDRIDLAQRKAGDLDVVELQIMKTLVAREIIGKTARPY